MLLLSFRHSSAVRTQSESHSENGVLITGIGQQKEELPECSEIAKSTFPGGCDPETSAFACFSMEKVYRPEHTEFDVPVHWACSHALDQKDINKESCSSRPWNFEDEIDGKPVKFTAPPGIYAGACQFSVLPKTDSAKAATTPENPPAVATTLEQLTEAATTPDQSAKAATTPEEPSVVVTTHEQLTKAATTVVATTPEQSTKAATTPEQSTSTKNGAPGNSAGSLLTTVLSLAVYYLH